LHKDIIIANNFYFFNLKVVIATNMHNLYIINIDLLYLSNNKQTKFNNINNIYCVLHISKYLYITIDCLLQDGKLL